jgi:hypothetical protein
VNTRGLVIWRADETAAGLVAGLAAATAGGGVDPDDVREIGPGGAVLDELRAAVAHLVQVRHRRDIRLFVVAAAADPAAGAGALIERVGEVSDLLRQVVAGAPGVVMTLLVPSGFAAAEERRRAAACLETIESRVGDLDLVGVCFLDAVLDSAGGVPDAVASGPDLLELLRREAADAALDPTIASVGHGSGVVRREWRGRRCRFSTLGAMRLTYPRAACLAHLLARMARQIFDEGFCDREDLSEKDLTALQARADAFVDRQVRDLGGRLPPSPVVGGHDLRDIASAEDVSERVVRATSEINRAMGGPLPRELLDAVAGGCRREIEGVLAERRGHLAGGLALVEALEGERLIVHPRQDPVPASGAPRFRDALCVRPLIASCERLLEPRLDDLLAGVGVAIAARQDDEAKIAWIQRCIDLAVAAAGGSGAGARVRFVEGVLEHVLGEAAVPPDAGDNGLSLVSRVLAVFESEAAPALGAMAQAADRLRAVIGQAGDLRRQYGWWQRIIGIGARAAEYRRERTRLERATREIEAERSALASSFAGLGDLLMSTLNEAILPYAWRSKLAAAFGADVARAASEYRGFLGGVAQALPGVEPVPDVRTATRITLHTPARLDALFEDVRRGRAWPEHAADALSFVLAGSADVPYAGCHDLSGHYRQDPALLARRIRDYARHRVAAVAGRRALDVLEMDGEIGARRFIEDTVRDAGRCLPFDETALLDFEREGQWDVVCVVQTGGGKTSDFAARYQGLFPPHVELIDSGDPDTIDITCLRFGFPATLLRGYG